MLSRKEFIYTSTLALGGLSFLHPGFLNTHFMQQILNQRRRLSPSELSGDDAFWGKLKNAFSLSTELLNFNHGGVNPQSIPVQKGHIEKYRLSNQGPAYYMWEKVDKQRETIRQKLSLKLGCSPEEIAINRNTTEGLNTVIFGIDLKAGDEVVLSKYDYPNMINALVQRSEREGIKLKWVDFNFPQENIEEIVYKYAQAITPSTRFILVPHIINWIGQILPVKEITAMAHQKGCEVIIDGAHAFAHLDFKLSDIGCDYYATSLHKWLGAPFGTGLLYVKQKHISKIWPLLSSYTSLKNDIRKFETLGTRSNAAEMAIEDALKFHENIGATYIEARFQYLKTYLIQQLKTIPGVSLQTSILPEFSCGLVTFSLNGYGGFELYNLLLEKYNVLTSAVVHEDLNSIRVTPHFFNTKEDINHLVRIIQELSK